MSDDFEVQALRASRQEIDRLKADLAAHKAALADVVERASFIVDRDLAWGTELAETIRSLAPPDAAPYAKVLEAARVLATCLKQSPNEVDQNGLMKWGADMREALAGIGRG